MNYKLWNKLLAQAPKDSVLMGGAIVDALFNVQPKDYDIFHTYKLGEPVVPNNWKMTEVDWNKPGVNELGNKPIGSVYEYLVDGEHLVQLIGVLYDNPVKHFKNFDHSLTLGRYTSRGLFIHRRVFDAKENNIVTYLSKNKNVDAVNRSLKRAKAKTAKYGGNWSFSDFGLEKEQEFGG